MSKGIASKNSLKALAYPVQQFIAGWGVREKPSAPKFDTQGHTRVIPPQINNS
jgi:hypothetical protein